jgi:threonine dehydratase
MAAIEDYSRPTTPDTTPNGLASPSTPKQTGLALTEYTANPSPSDESSQDKSSVIPEAFLLPNGYPDVGRGTD